MLSMLDDMDTASYTFRTYVVGNDDSFSAQKARNFESELENRAEQNHKFYGGYNVEIVPRARKVHQSLLSTPLSALVCLQACLAILRIREKNVMLGQVKDQKFSSSYPDIVISNGPATGCIMLLAGFLLRFAGFRGTKKSLRTIYIESWARVRGLSLSGKLLTITGTCDRLLVQWPPENNRSRLIGIRPEYRGPFVG